MVVRKRVIRADIQALRAIAVLAVVVYHLWPNRLTGGFMGVDIFFVISGYLMTTTLMHDINPVIRAGIKLRSILDVLTNFYARRIRRLVPAAAVTLLGILALSLLTGNFSTIEKTALHVAAAVVFLQNWQLSNEAVDYLSGAEPPTAVQHFWSLSLEEQFYLVWPLLLFAIIFITQHVLIVYKNRKTSGAILPITLLIVGFFAYGYYLTQANASVAYFSTPARVWELLLGGAIAFLPALRNYDLKLLLPWAGLALCTYALYRWDGTGFPGWHALIPTIGTALIIYGGTGISKSTLSFTHLFRWRPLQYIGNISYSLYLWHWPLIVLLPVLFTINIDGEHGRVIKLGVLVLSFIVASLSFRFVETPTQKLRLRKRWIYASFVVIVAIIGGLGLFVSTHAHEQAQTRLQELHAQALSTGATCLGGNAVKNIGMCNNNFGYHESRYDQLSANDKYDTILRTNMQCTIYQPEWSGESAIDPTRMCEVGDMSSHTTISLLGDSHAAQWINALDGVGVHAHVKFAILSSGPCGSVDANKSYCQPRYDYFKSSGILDKSTAVIVSVWDRTSNGEQAASLALAAAKSATDTPIYLLEDTPWSGASGGPGCLAIGASCTNTLDDAITTKNTPAHQDATTRGLITIDHIIPTHDMFCRDTTCYSYIGGLPVYRDATTAGNAHMTATYSLTQAGLLGQKLRDYHVIP